MSDKIVYSTETGPAKDGSKKVSHKNASRSQPGMKNDGIVRVQRESKGRGGKTVSVIYGLPLKEPELSSLAAKLKQRCGTGGAVKDGVIIIQGDKVDTVIKIITGEGFKVKRAGG